MNGRNHPKDRSSQRMCSEKKMFSQRFRKFHRKISLLESLFNEVAGLEVCNIIKKRFENKCEFFENTYPEEHLRTTASVKRGIL